jgi:hypothetical protein
LGTIAQREFGEDRDGRECRPSPGAALEQAHRILVPAHRVLPRDDARMQMNRRRVGQRRRQLGHHAAR